MIFVIDPGVTAWRGELVACLVNSLDLPSLLACRITSSLLPTSPTTSSRIHQVRR